MDQADLDARIQAYYSTEFAEGERLTTRSAQGRLELERVQELVAERVPPRSRIIDVGGATGVHAVRLAEQGHDVVLVDPVPAQVREASEHGTFRALVGDARDLPFDDDSFAAALLLGPLYHLSARADRVASLAEARRVVRLGGWVFAAAIPRFGRHASLILGQPEAHPRPAELVALLEHGSPAGGGRFPGAHFHTAEELQGELRDAGLRDVDVCAVEGPDGFALEQLREVDESVHRAALTMARTVGHLPGIRELSNHMMGIARV